MKTDQGAGGMVQANIESVAEMQKSLEERRTAVDRIADLIGGFSGSMRFVFLHMAWFVIWFLINTRSLQFVPVRALSRIPVFDPYPFILLAMIVSVEGVLLSTFVLMKQNRMQKRIDVRDHLNLQIDLLAEKEVTKSLQLLVAICERLGVPVDASDPELKEMAHITSVDMITEHLQQNLSADQ